ncbi:hypothetical protein CY35_04G069000 [Sphagnum magellanicum]|nr:hypothetical protein CY35_04G069000 [Sphagnum magellanicum]
MWTSQLYHPLSSDMPEELCSTAAAAGAVHIVSTWAQNTPSLRAGSGGGPPQFRDRLCSAQSSPYRPRSRQAVLEPRRCPAANNDTALCRNKKELYNTIVVTRTTLARSFIHTIIVESCCRCMCVSVSLCLSHITPGVHKLVFNQFQPKTAGSGMKLARSYSSGQSEYFLINLLDRRRSRSGSASSSVLQKQDARVWNGAVHHRHHHADSIKAWMQAHEASPGSTISKMLAQLWVQMGPRTRIT